MNYTKDEVQDALITSGILSYLSAELVEHVTDELTCTDSDEPVSNRLGSAIWSAAVSIANGRLNCDDECPGVAYVCSDGYFTVQCPDRSADEQRETDVLALAIDLLPQQAKDFIRAEEARNKAAN